MNVLLALFSYGGVHEVTVDCLIRELFHAGDKVSMTYTRISGDALISRSRSKVASMFLEMVPQQDVLFMLDHDIEFSVGDVIKTCQKAAEVNAIVGGMYSKRAFGMGFGSRFAASEDGRAVPGEDRLVAAEFVAAGFCAFPRSVLEAVRNSATTHLCADSATETFWDFFRPFTAPNPLLPGHSLYLSEDWAMTTRAAAAGHPSFIYMLPRLIHHGDHGYTVQDGQVRH